MTENHIHIFYIGSDGFEGIIATSMASLLFNTHATINFYIIDCGLSDFTHRKLKSLQNDFNNFNSIEFLPVDLEQEFKGFSRYWMNCLDTYARILIPGLKPELNKAIFLDSDTIIVGDIQELWNQDLGEHFIGAVPDFYENLEDHLVISKRGAKRFQTGVMLMNLNKFRTHNIQNKMLEIGRTCTAYITMADLSIFNLCFSDKEYSILPARYNFVGIIKGDCWESIYGIDDQYFLNEKKHMIIRHFSSIKPWRSAYNHQNEPLYGFDDFWFFAKKTPYFEGLQNKFYFDCINKISSKNPFSSFLIKGMKFFINRLKRYSGYSILKKQIELQRYAKT